MTDKKSCVESLNLAQENERRVAFASVRLGEVLIRGIAIWRSPKGHLRVYLPTYRLGAGFDGAIQLPQELRLQVETDVICAYNEATSRSASSADPQTRRSA